MARFELDARAAEKLYSAMRRLPGVAADEITNVFHGAGAKRIDEAIHIYMPRSGRSFAGKASAAKDSKSLVDRNKGSRLSVTIGTKASWHYLYFPDDGTSTIHHVGNQQFFRRGAQSVSDEIIDLCMKQITDKFGEGV